MKYSLLKVGLFTVFFTILCLFISADNLNGATDTPLIANDTTVNVTSLNTNASALNTNASALGIKCSNYSSNAYKIQFQYPSDWELKEKINRFDEGTDISISKISTDNPGLITVGFNTDLIGGFGSTDFITAFYGTFKDAISSDYSKEYRVVEQPSFVNIDGVKTGTFLYSYKDKYEDYPVTSGNQIWMTYVGNAGYLISFW